ncbi:MAG: hypothetical protein ACK47M_15110 [Caldilinea sp.]
MSFVLILHNLTRWAVIVLVIYALVRMFMGIFQKRDFTEQDRKSLSWFAISMDVQLLIGLVLFVGNNWWSQFQNMSNAMSQPALRFFVIEHWILMLIALVLAHLAVVFVRRAQSSASKFKRGATFTAIAAIAIFFAIPWPWSGVYGRPLFRLAESLMLWFA